MSSFALAFLPLIRNLILYFLLHLFLLDYMEGLFACFHFPKPLTAPRTFRYFFFFFSLPYLRDVIGKGKREKGKGKREKGKGMGSNREGERNRKGERGKREEGRGRSQGQGGQEEGEREEEGGSEEEGWNTRSEEHTSELQSQ